MDYEKEREKNLAQVKELVRTREEKWNDLFERYKKMDEEMPLDDDDDDEDVLSDYTAAELTDNESYIAEEESEAEEIDEDDIHGSDDECIEVSDDGDYKMSDFVSVFKEIAQQKIKVIENSYQTTEHKNIQNKDGSSKDIHRTTVRYSRTMESPMAAFKPNALMGRNDNSMALMSMKPSAGVIKTYTNYDVSEKNVYKKVVTTTTTTTTTTTEETTFLGPKDVAVTTDDEDVTSSNDKSVKLTKKKKPFANETILNVDYDDNDEQYCNEYQTPKIERRKRRVSVFDTPSSIVKATPPKLGSQTRLAIELTPKSRPKASNITKPTVNRKQIQDKLNESIGNIKKDECSPIIRNISCDEKTQLTLYVTPKQNAIMPAKVDPAFKLSQHQRPIIIKSRNDSSLLES